MFDNYMNQQSKDLNKDAPVILMLLLDCIAQLMIQNPTAFEFTSDLLVFLVDEYYLARYGSQLRFNDTNSQLSIFSVGSIRASLFHILKDTR